MIIRIPEIGSCLQAWKKVRHICSGKVMCVSSKNIFDNLVHNKIFLAFWALENIPSFLGHAMRILRYAKLWLLLSVVEWGFEKLVVVFCAWKSVAVKWYWMHIEVGKRACWTFYFGDHDFWNLKRKKIPMKIMQAGKNTAKRKLKQQKDRSVNWKREKWKLYKFGRLIFIWFSSYFHTILVLFFQNHILHIYIYIHRSSWNGGRQQFFYTNNRKSQEKLFLLKNVKPYLSSNVT